MKGTGITISILFLSLTLLGQTTKSIVPDFAVVQYAGSIGYLSGGVGYNIFKTKSRISFHWGAVPESQGGKLGIVTMKFFYEPKVFKINKMSFNPFDIGLMGTYHYGDDFKTHWPSELQPRGYYWWPAALRAHLALQSSATLHLSEGIGRDRKSITGYIEFNTNELYVVSYIQNIRTLSLFDIIKVGAGIRYNF